MIMLFAAAVVKFITHPLPGGNRESCNNLKFNMKNNQITGIGWVPKAHLRCPSQSNEVHLQQISRAVLWRCQTRLCGEGIPQLGGCHRDFPLPYPPTFLASEGSGATKRVCPADLKTWQGLLGRRQSFRDLGPKLYKHSQLDKPFDMKLCQESWFFYWSVRSSESCSIPCLFEG